MRFNYWTVLGNELSAKLSLGFVLWQWCLCCQRDRSDLVYSRCEKLPSVKRFQTQPAVLVPDKYSAHK